MLKLKFLFTIFFVFFILIVAKLFYIQVFYIKTHPTDYLTIQSLQPERGRIFDRNGAPMVVNESIYRLFAEPKLIADKEEMVTKLENILHIGEATLEARIDLKKDWVSVKSEISPEIKDKISKLKLAGLGFEEQRKRYYPESSLSAHLVGFVGKNAESDSVGYFGLEGYYDKELTGISGVMRSERDLIGRPIFVGTQERVDPEDGRDLYLSIDKTVQHIAKTKLLQGIERYKAKEGCVIVANPMTMELLAMTCLPDFDPDKYYDFTEDYFKNPAITNVYEPGSIFKPLIVAAGVEQKAIKPDEIFDEDGPVTVGGYTIRTWDNKYEGRISMTRILEKSSNVGMVYIGNKMGDKSVLNYVKKFGFGEKTGIDLQGEFSSYLKPDAEWYPIDYATVTFGQGIAVTPLQMVRAFSSIINGGKLMQPYVVSSIQNDGEIKKHEPVVSRRTVSDRTSEIIKKMLVMTVENGEIKWAKPKGYKIGGKTGTAQIAIEGKYDPNKTIASFMGFGPADDPKFIALVVLREPQASIWGSETAAPLFFEIAKELLAYYNIPPTSNE